MKLESISYVYEDNVIGEVEKTFFFDTNMTLPKSEKNRFINSLIFAIYGEKHDELTKKSEIHFSINGKSLILKRMVGFEAELDLDTGDNIAYGDKAVLSFIETVFPFGSNDFKNMFIFDFDSDDDNVLIALPVDFIKKDDIRLFDQIFSEFLNLECDPEDKYQESTLKDSIVGEKSIKHLSSFITTMKPLYEKTIAEIDNKIKSASSKKVKIVYALSERDKYMKAREEMDAFQGRKRIARQKIDECKKQIEYLKGEGNTFDIDKKELENLEKMRPFYLANHQKSEEVTHLEERISELENEITVLEKKQSSFQKILELNDMKVVDKPACDDVQMQRQALMEILQRADMASSYLVTIDESAEISEYNEGLMEDVKAKMASIRDGENNTALKKRYQTYKKQMEEADRDREQSQMLCVQILKECGVENPTPSSIRDDIPKLIAKTKKQLDEISTGEEDNNEDKTRFLLLKNEELFKEAKVNYPALIEKDKKLIDEMKVQKASLEKEVKKELEGKLFVSYADLCVSIQAKEERIDEYQRILKKNQDIVKNGEDWFSKIGNKERRLQKELDEADYSPDADYTKMESELCDLSESIAMAEKKKEMATRFIDKLSLIESNISKFYERVNKKIVDIFDVGGENLNESFKKYRLEYGKSKLANFNLHIKVDKLETLFLNRFSVELDSSIKEKNDGFVFFVFVPASDQDAFEGLDTVQISGSEVCAIKLV